MAQSGLGVGSCSGSVRARHWGSKAQVAAGESGSARTADGGPAGAWLPEVEAQDTGVTQGGGGSNRGSYAGLSDGWGGEEMK